MTTTAEDVWQLLAELAIAQKATERLLQEQSQEADRRFKETECLLREQSQDTERLLRERAEKTDQQFKETDRKIREVNQQIGDLGGKWGRFVENIVAPACETIFLKRGIPVHQVGQRIKKQSIPASQIQRIRVDKLNHDGNRNDDIKENITDKIRRERTLHR